MCGSFPQREVFLSSRHGLAEEVEFRCYDVVAEQVCSVHNLSPLHIVTVFGRCETTDEFVGSRHEVGLSDNHLINIFQVDACCLELTVELSVGVTSVKLLACDLVVVGLRVAELSRRLRRLSQCGFKLHDVLHLCLRSFLAEAQEFEHADDMFLVSLPDGCGCWVFVYVVRLLSECYSGLPHVEDILL